MATINLGNIKFNWKGTYAGGTAYVVDDVVSYSGSSYVCKLASTGNLPTNGTYWDVMASAGTNGTDVGTTITTQGDVLYRDGSGLQRLAAGTSGHVLTTGGTGANPSWAAAVGGKVLQAVSNVATGNYTTSSTSFTYVSGAPSVSITPATTGSKILVMFSGGATEMNGGNGYVTVYRDSTNLGNANGFWNIQHHANYREGGSNGVFLDSPNSTSALTYQIQIRNSAGNQISFGESSSTSIICIEIGA